jgi:bifunctional DNase/RNase
MGAEVLAMPPGAEPVWVETEVTEVCRPDRPEEPQQRTHVVVLRERGGPRRLPMFTGSAEAIALACSLEAGELPRRGAYQLAANLLAAAGSRLAEVRITTLAEGVFYAAAVVEGPGGTVEVDARPSDAVNLAVLAGAPILVDAAILDDPVVDSHPEWERYPARLADLVAEERQRRADFQANVAKAQEGPLVAGVLGDDHALGGGDAAGEVELG